LSLDLVVALWITLIVCIIVGLIFQPRHAYIDSLLRV
jgi:hypothetical protein